jgi:hypothetical protein
MTVPLISLLNSEQLQNFGKELKHRLGPHFAIATEILFLSEQQFHQGREAWNSLRLDSMGS